MKENQITGIVSGFMSEIYKQAAKELFRITNKSSPLRFPKYFNKDKKPVRISEQESKLILANLFFKNQIPFAVEVPTEVKFNFSGSGEGKSARYDLAIYENEPYHAIKYVIELKAHNPEYKQIRKDIEKFACSDLDCIWFHTLEKADTNTYKKLFVKINSAIESEKAKILGKHQWAFVIVNLEKNELYVCSKIISKDNIIHFNGIDNFDKIL